MMLINVMIIKSDNLVVALTADLRMTQLLIIIMEKQAVVDLVGAAEEEKEVIIKMCMEGVKLVVTGHQQQLEGRHHPSQTNQNYV